jgi:hypothetical protein
MARPGMLHLAGFLPIELKPNECGCGAMYDPENDTWSKSEIVKRTKEIHGGN